MDQPLSLDLFDYVLPPERIAQEPVRPRHASRLMVVPRGNGPCEHRRFLELPELLSPGDLVVVNRTAVIPARLFGRKPSGGKVELLFVQPYQAGLHEARVWQAMGRPGKALEPGARVIAAEGIELTIEARAGEMVTTRASQPIWEILVRHGQVPLPPYIARPDGAVAADRDDYQTLFAREPGAVAAPTASLHFTETVRERLEKRGVRLAEIVLHVGPGTFLPVRPEHATDVRGHAMHAESYDVPLSTQSAVESTRAAGRRVVAVGTTVVRALETWRATGDARGASELFILPGYRFAAVDAVVTNFHLPRSTLLMLVAAFAGRERVLAAYREAVGAGYRFYSYGDAMLLQ